MSRRDATRESHAESILITLKHSVKRKNNTSRTVRRAVYRYRPSRPTRYGGAPRGARVSCVSPYGTRYANVIQ